MIGLISIIFTIVFCFIHRVALTPFNIGVLILLSMGIFIIDVNLSSIMRILKNERD